MNLKPVIGITAAATLLAVLAVALWLHPAPLPARAAQISGNGLNNSGVSANQQRVLFSSTQYAPYSYQIYPGPVSQQAQAALAGFNITSSALQNGSTDMTLAVSGTSQHQSILLESGYKLYIVEASFGDDSFHSDYSLGDDAFVIVNRNGYIVQ